MNQLTDTTNNIWRVINTHKRLIIAIFVIATVGYLVFGRSSGLTQEKFQDKIYKVSNGVIDINDSKIEKVNDGSSVYMAKWNGFTITASVDSKNRIIFPYGVIGLPSNQMDEISLGQYQEIMKALSSVADSKLSDEDKERLILNELNFNNVIETGTKHSASKNGIRYELIGSEGVLLFMLGDKK